VFHTGSNHRAALAALIVLSLCGCSDDDTSSAMNEATGNPDAGAGSDTDSGRGDPGEDTDPSRPAGMVGENEDGVDPLPPLPDEVALPIVFAHGFAGSAQQYESQAMRFAANGYPLERIKAYDHDGAGLDIPGYVMGLDAVIDAALEEFDVPQVYLVGHSRGTSVSTSYLQDATRAAKVAKYIAIDGRPCPTVVPCLAPNQAGNPGQAHVEVATSKESFAMQYAFLIGEEPEVVDIVAQREPVTISGRAVNFPANTGRDGATLEIWEIDSETGMRATDEPRATFQIGEDGDWGPVMVDSRKHYEFVLFGENTQSHHLYPQRFLRDSQLVRLLSGGPDSASRMNSNTSDMHANIIVMRMREWYAADDPDLDGGDTDVLEVSVNSESGDTDPVNAITADVGNGAIGLHIHDAAASPGDSTLAPLPYFSEQPFQAGVDVFMPAADPPDGTITVTNMPRGDTDRPQTLNVPNWTSAGHAISLMFSDFPQD
jgi:pimeloyl-ACP methyl ester carboxylesterase